MLVARRDAEAVRATRVDAFLERLSGLLPADWMTIGRMAEQQREYGEARDAELAIVQAIIADHHLEVSSWYARDLVETFAYLATRRQGERLAGSSQLSAARGAVERAVLALLVRPWLPEAVFGALYKPVAKYIS